MDCGPPGSSVHRFSRQEYWRGLPFPSPGDPPNTWIEPRSPALQVDSLVGSLGLGKPFLEQRQLSQNPGDSRLQADVVVKNPLSNTGDIRDLDSVPGSGRSPGGGHGNPLQYSCLEKPTDRGAWWAAVLGVTQSQTRLKQLGTAQHWAIRRYQQC